MDALHRLAAALWRRAGGRVRWRLLRWHHDTFLVGLTGVVLDDQGRVLVLVHRYWMGNPCGLPSGYAVSRETWERGLAREIAEETGLRVEQVEVVAARSGFPGRVEVLLRGLAAPGAIPVADGKEVVSAEFLDPQVARTRLRAEHVRMLDEVIGAGRPARP
jgi:NADH pyrophosphatase NudC (nudix superfamily)